MTGLVASRCPQMKTSPDIGFFKREALDFLAELELNNNRKWFLANRERYEEFIHVPMRALAEELIPRMQKHDSEIRINPDEALFAIGRDTHASPDKSPYKTHVGLLIARQGPTGYAHPGLYVQISNRAFAVASGFHALEPGQTIAMRRYLAANHQQFLKQLGNRSFQTLFLGIRGEACKVLPPEFRVAAEKQPLLYNRQFYYWAEHGPDRALFRELPEFSMQHMDACRPMNEFLSQAFHGV